MKTNVTFTLPAEAVEGATEALLLGDFNNWNPEKAPRLEKQQDGSYKAVAQLETGHTYQYRFLLDNSRWVNDYHAQNYLNIPGYYVDNCVITVPEQVVEDKKDAQPEKTKTGIEKKTKAAPIAKEETSVKADSVEKPAKKASAKKSADKTIKAKSAGEKAESKKAEKPAKADKKSASKAKK